MQHFSLFYYRPRSFSLLVPLAKLLFLRFISLMTLYSRHTLYGNAWWQLTKRGKIKGFERLKTQWYYQVSTGNESKWLSFISKADSVNVIVARHSISGTLETVHFAIFSNKSVCNHQMSNDREGVCAFLSLD
jgi:hypothetical protein